jgi:predicted RNase H-like HicB family nuclease
MNQPLTYKLLLREEPEGGYTAFVPTLEGCVTYGETLDEAISNAKEAAELYIESLKENGETVPTEQRMFEYSLTLTT